MKINWNEETYKGYIDYLKKISDTKTRDFNIKIFNTKYEVLGIKTPILKDIAKDIAKQDMFAFLKCCKSQYFEEIMIEGFVISYIKDNNTFLDYYIDDSHIDNVLSLCYKESSYYYVNMAISWLISACFIKYRTKTLDLLKSKKMSVFVQNKAISKIRDSYRVSKEDKELVKSFRL